MVVSKPSAVNCRAKRSSKEASPPLSGCAGPMMMALGEDMVQISALIPSNVGFDQVVISFRCISGE